MGKLNVTFVCVHNSCRSQIAEALGKKHAADVFESYSAGIQTKPQINRDAVRLMKQEHGIDMEQTQYSKLLTELPEPEIVITMGWNVQCLFLLCNYREAWGRDDYGEREEAVFLFIMQQIEEKVLNLKQRIISGELR